jgi:hypothetical protein
MNPNRLLAVLQPFINVLLVIFLLGFAYGLMSRDEYEDDEFTVTITYDCKQVLTDRDYPTEVLQECLELRDEIQRRNH